MHSFGDIKDLCARPAKGKLARILLLSAVILPLACGAYFAVRVLKHQLWRGQQSGIKSNPNLPNMDFVPRAPELQIGSVVRHGHIVEIKGSTEPGAVVMINGQPAATFFDGSSFRHFVGPLPDGTTIVTITIQNGQGGVTTRQLAVTVD
jgi:hypothetical protein